MVSSGLLRRENLKSYITNEAYQLTFVIAYARVKLAQISYFYFVLGVLLIGRG
jgi:hypothetical protein